LPSPGHALLATFRSQCVEVDGESCSARRACCGRLGVRCWSDCLRTTAPAGRRQMEWLSRSGQKLGCVGNPDDGRLPSGSNIALSPDGKYIAMNRVVDGNHDIWLLSTARGVFSRFTFETAANHDLRWSPDGQRVVYNSDRSGVFDLYVKSASGVGNEQLLLA